MATTTNTVRKARPVRVDALEAALEELESLNEQRVEKMNRLRITEREKDSLESKRQNALAFLRAQNAYVRAQSMHMQYNMRMSEARQDKVIEQMVCSRFPLDFSSF